MVSRRTRVAFWIFRRDHPSRPNAMICCCFSSFKTFAISREATYPPAAVNVLDVSSESMAAFQVFTYGRFWVFTEAGMPYRANSHKVTILFNRFVLAPKLGPHYTFGRKLGLVPTVSWGRESGPLLRICEKEKPQTR